MTVRHALTLWIGLSCLLLAAPVSAQAPDLDRLLARFAALPGLEADFSEERTMELLAVPVRSEGHLWFAGDPARLMRRVRTPEPSAALIASGELRMESGGRVQTIPIAENAVLRGFVDSFRAVLDGNREDLDRHYEATLTARPDAGADAWELTLRPRSRELREFLRTITMRGRGVVIEEMLMVEQNGDRTRTVFRSVRTDRRFSVSEAARIFRL